MDYQIIAHHPSTRLSRWVFALLFCCLATNLILEGLMGCCVPVGQNKILGFVWFVSFLATFPMLAWSYWHLNSDVRRAQMGSFLCIVVLLLPFVVGNAR
jgi:hypothetical protein